MDAVGTGGRLRVGACLSLSGRFAQFGRQAAHGLRVWASLDGQADVLIEDDASDVHQVQVLLPGVAAGCDLLLGPYSTVLMRAAGDIAAESGWLIWNHGGSGDDVETAHPGHVVSVLTPTSRYMEPFLSHLAAEAGSAQELRIAHGKGRFGLQVASGAEAYARHLGFTHVSMGPADAILGDDDLPENWVLITAGIFEEDTETVMRARRLVQPPRVTCAVAAGIRDFSHAVERPDGTFGIAQWFQGSGHVALLGPSESEFLDAYYGAAGEMPDYPAIQAAATASLAAHCARQAGSTDPTILWPAATALDTSTLYGAFKIDQTTGAQASHQTVLTRWIEGELLAASHDSSKPEAQPGSPSGSWHAIPLITYEDARRRAQQLLDDSVGEPMVVTGDHEFDEGWVFFYDSIAHQESGDFLALLGGNAPILIDRETGQIQPTGTARPIEEYIEEYAERKRRLREGWPTSLDDRFLALLRLVRDGMGLRDARHLDMLINSRHQPREHATVLDELVELEKRGFVRRLPTAEGGVGYKWAVTETDSPQ